MVLSSRALPMKQGPLQLRPHPDPVLHISPLQPFIHLGHPVPYRSWRGREESEVPATGPDHRKEDTMLMNQSTAVAAAERRLPAHGAAGDRRSAGQQPGATDVPASNVVELYPGAGTRRGKRRGRTRRPGSEAGMATAEYAIATLAAVGFAGLLVFILRSDEVRGFLLNLIRTALALP